MFESIRGPLVLKEPARCVVEAGGMGYAIQISLSTYDDLPRAGQEASLYLHPVVRDDDWRLFGFSKTEERQVFRDLVKVNGVGPVMALSLLSGFRPAELAGAVAQADIRALTRVKGIGKKTAERMVVELRDRWKDGAVTASALGTSLAAPGAGDAVQALEALGLATAEAQKRVARILKAQPEAAVPDVVRQALRG